MRSLRKSAEWWLALPAAVGSLWGAVPARAAPPDADAAPPSVAVEPSGCTGLDVAETERLLRIELTILAARAERVRAPVVHVTCSGSRITVRVFDAVAQRTIEETLPAPKPTQPGRERVIALAASQLFLSSWLEVVLQDKPAPKPPPAPPPARKPAPTAPREVPREAAPHWDLSMRGALRAYHLQAPSLGLGPALELGMHTGALRLAVYGSADRARAERGGGEVVLTLLGGGISAAFESRNRPLRWMLGGRADARALRAEGRADPPLRGQVARGSAFTAAVFGGPLLLLGSSWALGADVCAGALLPEVVAHVSGADSVSLSGPFVGADAFLRFGFGGLP